MLTAVTTAESLIGLFNNFRTDVSRARDIYLILNIEKSIAECIVFKFNA